jgi:hypothetical protein
MSRTHTVRTVLGLAMVFATCVVVSEAQGATIEFHCAYPETTTCFFTVFAGEATSSFTLKGDEKGGRDGLQVGQHTYCVNTKGPNRADCKPETIAAEKVIAKPTN